MCLLSRYNANCVKSNYIWDYRKRLPNSVCLTKTDVVDTESRGDTPSFTPKLNWPRDGRTGDVESESRGGSMRERCYTTKGYGTRERKCAYKGDGLYGRDGDRILRRESGPTED